MPVSILLIGESSESFGLISDCLRYNGYSLVHSHPRDVGRAGRHDACLLLCTTIERALTALSACRFDGYFPPVLALVDPGSNMSPTALLNGGADIVLSLPIPADHLIAQLKASLRRTEDALDGSVTLGQVTLVARKQLVLRSGVPVQLTAVEFKILRALMRRPGAIVSKTTLAMCLPQPQTNEMSRSVAVHIHSLRRKLGSNWIRTVRSLGYSLMHEA